MTRKWKRRARAPAFADGAWFVSLAAVARPEAFASAIVQALAIEPLDDEPPEPAAERFLGPRHVLLVLDNLEHLLEAVTLVGRLVSACPRLTVLATSREPLGLAAEQRQPVAALTAANAVELFSARARAHDPAFALTDTNTATVTEICRRVDCLPLAIELPPPAAACSPSTSSPPACTRRSATARAMPPSASARYAPPSSGATTC